MKYTITNIRRGQGSRSIYVYAEVRDSDGKLCVAATFDYCYYWVNSNV